MRMAAYACIIVAAVATLTFLDGPSWSGETAECPHATACQYVNLDEGLYGDVGREILHNDPFLPNGWDARGESWVGPVTLPKNYEHPPLGKYVWGFVKAIEPADSRINARIAASAITGGVAGLLFLVIVEAGSVRAGLVAASIFAVDPVMRGALGLPTLDGPYILFGLAACLAAWQRQPAIAAVLVGLSGATKIPGFFFLAPVVYVSLRPLRGATNRVVQAGAYASIAGLTYITTYLPFWVAWTMKLGPLGAVASFAKTQLLQFWFHQLGGRDRPGPAEMWFYNAGDIWDYGGQSFGTVAVWGTLLFTMAIAAWLRLARQVAPNPLLAFATVGVAATLGPLFLLDRGAWTVLYAMPILPFLAIAGTMLVPRISQTQYPSRVSADPATFDGSGGTLKSEAAPPPDSE